MALLEKVFHWAVGSEVSNAHARPVSYFLPVDSDVELSTTSPVPWLPIYHHAPHHDGNRRTSETKPAPIKCLLFKNCRNYVVSLQQKKKKKYRLKSLKKVVKLTVVTYACCISCSGGQGKRSPKPRISIPGWVTYIPISKTKQTCRSISLYLEYIRWNTKLQQERICHSQIFLICQQSGERTWELQGALHTSSTVL